MNKANRHKSESVYKREKNTRDFLLSFFSPDEKYSEKEVDGFVLIKQFANYMWSVAIFTRDAYLKRKKYKHDFASVLKNRTRGNGESEYK